MDAKTVKTNLAEIFTGLVGTYKLNESLASVPAIWIGTPPKILQRVGLEVLIPAAPIVFTQRGNITRRQWEIYLVQNPSTQPSLHIAIQRLEKLANASVRYLPAIQVSGSPNFEFCDQAELTWLDWAF